MASPPPDRHRWSAAPFVPDTDRLDVLAPAAAACTGCPLHVDTTQTVFGEGPRDAALILVGEQPGDQEDKKGQPFVGPAGRVLWRCIDDAGVERGGVYVTNAVKHFKHEARGPRRLHKTPTSDEIEACHPWLQAELRTLAGRVVVAMGATAARGLLGRHVGIAITRGLPVERDGRRVFVTYHPSAVLRADDAAEDIRAALVEDLRHAAREAGLPLRAPTAERRRRAGRRDLP